MGEPEHNPFHLGGLREYGLSASISAPQGKPWAIGAFRGDDLAGVVMAMRGTGGVCHSPGDSETLDALAEALLDRASAGSVSLLSGHASQIEPLLPLLQQIGVGRGDRCHFRTLYPGDLAIPQAADGFGAPRLAVDGDMEKLIDFYEIGFYSLANLPSRSAWRNRLLEQLALRTLFIIEDDKGEVASAALSSAEGGGAAMLGGVATREKYRGMGLSALCVGALCDCLFMRSTVGVSLFYLKDNSAAGHVYDKLGFGYAGEWLLVPLGMGVLFSPLLGLRTR